MDATASALVSTLAALQETMESLSRQMALEKATQLAHSETIKALRSRVFLAFRSCLNSPQLINIGFMPSCRAACTQCHRNGDPFV